MVMPPVVSDVLTSQKSSFVAEQPKPQMPFVDSVMHNAVYMLQRFLINNESNIFL